MTMSTITTTPQSSSSSISNSLLMSTSLFFSKPKFLYNFFTTPFCSKSSSSNASVIIKLNNNKKQFKKITETQLAKNYLDSLSSPFVNSLNTNTNNNNNSFVVGIDPDGSGALALLKLDHTGSLSPQVFDSPHLKIMVGGRVRKRLDTKAIVQLLRSIDAPSGTTAYIEQSTPYPKDGKQGWYSGGFAYGLWIGVLVASGYSVVPVPSNTWKKEFELSGNGSTKDNSRMVASMLFPSVSSQLTRKKDHGRAEALLIAAYGQGLKAKSHSIEILE